MFATEHVKQNATKSKDDKISDLRSQIYLDGAVLIWDLRYEI